MGGLFKYLIQNDNERMSVRDRRVETFAELQYLRLDGNEIFTVNIIQTSHLTNGQVLFFSRQTFNRIN